MKRFYEKAEAYPVDAGYTVMLDGRGIKTPGKAEVIVPTLALAQAMAAEWSGQGDEIDRETLALGGLAGAAIDNIQPRLAEAAAEISAYGGHDLLCYRADRPRALVLRQAEKWQPLLDWAAGALKAPLNVTDGIVHVGQPRGSLKALGGSVSSLDAYALSGLNRLVRLTGSLILGLAVLKQHIDADAAYEACQLDEHWQAEQWGTDDEALVRQINMRADITCAGRYLSLLQDQAAG